MCIVVHLGSSIEEEGGHIITLLNTSKGWITCNDVDRSNPSSTLPALAKQGYLFIYDKIEDAPPTLPVTEISMAIDSNRLTKNDSRPKYPAKTEPDVLQRQPEVSDFRAGLQIQRADHKNCSIKLNCSTATETVYSYSPSISIQTWFIKISYINQLQ